MENLGTIVLAVGGLGTAAFGIVEALKWTPIGLMGFGQVTRLLGEPVLDALKVAYGPASTDLLEAQYRTGRSAGQLPKSIRQGVRVGLTPDTAGALAGRLGVVAADDLVAVARALQEGAELTDEQRGILGRFELALDTRIDSALALADDRYAGAMRVIASLVSIAIALAVGVYAGQSVLLALIVGIAAVPIAPMAKDLSSAIRAAGQALPGGK